jgi:hypothetical protein
MRSAVMWVRDVGALSGGAPKNAAASRAEGSARAAMAKALGVPVEKLKVSFFSEGTTFGDSSLGLSEPGSIYAPVMTRGFVIDGESQGHWFRFHAAEGGAVKLASRVSPAEAQPVIAEVTQKASSELGVPASAVRVLGIHKQVQEFGGFDLSPASSMTTFDVKVQVKGKLFHFEGELGGLERLRFEGGAA